MGTMLSGLWLYDAQVIVSLTVLGILFAAPFIAPCERR
jgi:hypothetical protein